MIAPSGVVERMEQIWSKPVGGQLRCPLRRIVEDSFSDTPIPQRRPLRSRHSSDPGSGAIYTRYIDDKQKATNGSIPHARRISAFSAIFTESRYSYNSAKLRINSRLRIAQVEPRLRSKLCTPLGGKHAGIQKARASPVRFIAFSLRDLSCLLTKFAREQREK